MALAPPEPEDFARQLLEALNITRVTDLETVLNPLRLSVRERNTRSFEGALVCRRDRSKGIIVLSNAIRESGRRRFTICHEIGHFVLPGHGESGCQPNKIESWRDGSVTKETDANRFASELLLPVRIVYPFAAKHKVTIDSAVKLSEEFEVSLTASAYKLVNVTEEKCAVIWSVNGQVVWFKKNDNFSGYITGGILDEQSLAAYVMKNASTPHKEGSVHFETWLSGDGLSGKDTLWEDSLFLPYYNAVLTVITTD